MATSVDEAHAPTLVPITPAPVTPAPVTPAPVTDAPTSHSPTKSPPVAATDVPVVTPVITDTPHIMSMSMSHSMSIATKVSFLGLPHVAKLDMSCPIDGTFCLLVV